MYQPRFSPLDSITMTTHPFVVAKAAQIGSLLLNRELRIMTPFEDLTKAEVIAISPEKDGLRYTHSCISSRFGTHDGTCYGCVIRRLATTAVGVKDVTYSRNPISDSNAHAGNLYSLLGFCHDILTDFRRMKEYERGIIDVYGKRDLFRRFALDNFAAIHRLLSDNKRVVRPVRDLYNSVSREIGAAIFDHRLRELARTTVPDHSKWAGEVRKPPTRPKVMSDARFEATRWRRDSPLRGDLRKQTLRRSTRHLATGQKRFSRSQDPAISLSRRRAALRFQSALDDLLIVHPLLDFYVPNYAIAFHAQSSPKAEG
jgi:queuosine biosynthesis protein QueC